MMMVFAVDRLRDRKSRSGISGALAKRPSLMRKPPRITAPATMSASVEASPQPVVSVRTMPNTSRDRPMVALSAPGRSKWRVALGLKLSVSMRAATAAAIRPMGMLMKRIQRQLSRSVRMPPSSTPAAPPAPPIAPQIPTARLRSAGSVKVVVMIDRLAGAMIAPPSPWTNRAMISTLWLLASPPANDDSANSTRPVTNTRRRPTRSAARPPSRRKPAKVMV